ncbi:microsomal triglyceride transfer protein large subunit isoform X2 [Cephus cinctus]|uniref:Microsomal triglyceride transfer protein large subunit isoform X2 n=1 Tax=Cephus cinctus TaxID=211228 RepID=A0AAJ7FH32_CEPCN|nr:microsomal triglyceride transfer protein large subunit isoform X2 [Cephus cinctus]
MAWPERPVAVTISLVSLLAFFAVAGTAPGWNLGKGLRYELTTTTLFKEVGPVKFGDVGFQLTGQVVVTALWKDPKDADAILLKIELISPQLWIKSRKAPEPEGFVEHSSKLDKSSKSPVFILWKNGEILAVYLDPSETVSNINLKRGLASLFQYRTLDGEFKERDASGLCSAIYNSAGPRSIRKQKIACEQSSLTPVQKHPNPIMDVDITSNRNSSYELTHALLLNSVIDYESHAMNLRGKQDVGTTVTSQRTLKLLPGTFEASPVQADSVKDAVALLEPSFRKTQIDLQPEPAICPESGCVTLEEMLEENREALDNSALGSVKSAVAFLKLIPLVRNAGPEELAKLLKSPRYRELKSQLYDLLGSAGTPAAHQAAMKILKQDERGDDTERYLWALSMSATPHADIAKDILRRSEETMQNDKISETLALTAAAMARQHGSPAVIERARASLEIGLDSCTGEECKLKFLRALRNLRSKVAIPTLLSYASNGTRAISVAAWRALGALPKEHLTKEVKIAAAKTFYQIGGPKRDSSARTLALDIILEADPSKEDLQGLVQYLSTNDSVYEVRKYLTQRMEQIAEKNSEFAKNLKEAFQTEGKKVMNYNALALKGLSTAFTRTFLNSPGSNGSLVTVQEVSSGLLKRGVVDVILESGKDRQSLFSLGLFAGGLGSFVSSSEDNSDSTDEDETATAGMDISFLGVGIRPFVFFSGQGELMGHVWSGTASERTPAFQTLTNLHRHKEFIPLSSGFIAEIDVDGAASFDLAGKIQLSLWSRNAQSLVEMGSGIAIRGASKIRSDFVQSTAEFSLSMEPKLELATDVDFSGSISLCMRLTQPRNTVRHNIYKIERIPGSRHKLRKTRRTKFGSPAKSYLLNRKNNEMCSKVFS